MTQGRKPSNVCEAFDCPVQYMKFCLVMAALRVLERKQAVSKIRRLTSAATHSILTIIHSAIKKLKKAIVHIGHF